MQVQADLKLAPVHAIEAFQLGIEHPSIRLPLVGSLVTAGFPSPADDYIEDFLDLNELKKLFLYVLSQ